MSPVYCDIFNKDNHTSHVPNPHRTTHAYCSYCSESSSAINERILQVDGNASMDDDDDFSESDTISNLSSLSLPQTGDQFSVLPTIYSANARSVFSKFEDLVHTFHNSRIDLAQISETWQDVNKHED